MPYICLFAILRPIRSVIIFDYIYIYMNCDNSARQTLVSNQVASLHVLGKIADLNLLTDLRKKCKILLKKFKTFPARSRFL